MLDKAAAIELYRVRFAANDRVTIDAEAGSRRRWKARTRLRRHTGFRDG